jgi:hypothetical protein
VNRGTIGRARHQPVEDIEFADEVTLADAANRWIARHLAGILRPKCKQADARTATGRRSRSLASGMASADHQYVVHDLGLA